MSNNSPFVVPVGDPAYLSVDNVQPAIIATPADHQRLRPLHNWPSDSAVDIAVPCGTPLRAPLTGTIVRAGPQKEGKYKGDLRIAIDSGEGTAVFMGHLGSIDWARVAVGRRIEAGEVIGTTGSAEDICHLHFGMGRDYRDRTLANGIDPMPRLPVDWLTVSSAEAARLGKPPRAKASRPNAMIVVGLVIAAIVVALYAWPRSTPSIPAVESTSQRTPTSQPVTAARNCLKRLFGDNVPTCDDAPGGDGTMKRTTLNGVDLGLCRKVSNDGCIAR